MGGEARGTLTTPPHLRRLILQIEAGPGSDVVFDDAFLSAVLSEPYDPDALFRDRPPLDDHTLARITFDEEDEPFSLFQPARVVEDGRFGQGLRIGRDGHGSAVIPLSVDEMPETGTLEFWFAPDGPPPRDAIHRYIELFAGSLEQLHVQVDTSHQARAVWRTEGARYGRWESAGSTSRFLREWLRADQWHHVAVQWDGEAVRFYVNGVLAAWGTGTPQPFFQVPSGIRLGSYYSVYAWDGRIDEIRLSSVQRYGPFVPVGTEWTPMMVHAAAVSDPAESEATPVPAPDFGTLRAQQTHSVPALPGDVRVLDASEARPLFDGDPVFSLKADSPVPGFHTAASQYPGRWEIRDPFQHGIYWTVPEGAEGLYTLGLWGRGVQYVYLNGRIVQCSTRSIPMRGEGGAVWQETQSAEAVPLRPGDEIAVLVNKNTPLSVTRLALHPRPPERGPFWVPTLNEANWWNPDTVLGLTMVARFLGTDGPALVARPHFRHEQQLHHPDRLRRAPDGRALVECSLVNPLPVALRVRFRAEIRSYYRELVGSDEVELTLAPHERVVREIPFEVIPDSARYSIHARAEAIDPPDPQADLGWPAHDRVALFDGLRQDLPWSHPFRAEERRSLLFTGRLPGPRSTRSLAGSWEGAFTTELEPPMPPPGDLEWIARTVPMPRHACSKPHPQVRGIYMRRTFRLPDELGEATLRLVIPAVTDEATVYVNGQRVGNVRGGNTPLTCDITAAAQPGENEVVVVIRDLVALMNPVYVNRANPVPDVAYLDAPGLHSRNGFSLEGAWIEFSPRIAVHRVLAKPSVRRGELAARFDLTSHASAPRALRVTTRVLDAGRPALDLDRREIELAPEETRTFEMSASWPDAELWGPGNPKLYTLAIEVADAGSGEVLDLNRVRFGFRETWIEGDRLIFNGRPVRFKASTVHGGQGTFEDGIQLGRGAAIPDFMDEFGALGTQFLAMIANSSSRHNVDRDEFWETATDNVLVGAERLGNHASIIAWDLSNEWLGFLDYGGGDPMAGARRFKTLSDTLQAYDPTRFTFFNGDEDLHGLHDNYSTHYMLESTNPHPTGRYGFRGHSNYFPDGAFFRPLERMFEEAERVRINVHRGQYYMVGSKPIMNTENIWKTGMYMPPGPSRFVGDRDVLHYAFDSASGPAVWMWKMNVDGHRDLGCSAVFNYSAREGLSRRAYMTETFIMPDHTHHGFVGRTLVRDYSVHNDRLVPAAMRFAWRLIGPDGVEHRQGTEDFAMDSGDMRRGRFAFELPEVDARTRFVLRLDLYADGESAYAEERDLDVWPADPLRIRPDYTPPAGPRALYLLDPGGSTATAFDALGIRFSRWTPEDPWPEPDRASLIVGEGALDHGDPPSESGLARFVEQGGRLLVLAQRRILPGLPVRTLLEPREWTSMPFIRAARHPVLRDITDWDLKFWAPDHVVARGAYSKPARGAFIPLVDSGGIEGMESVQMMECYRGEGLVLLNQLAVIDKFDAEPMARELLVRMAGYLAGEEPFRRPAAALAVPATLPAVLRRRLDAVGVSTRPLSSVQSGDVRFIAAQALSAESRPEPDLVAALHAGATVLLHHATPEHEAYLRALTGVEVSVGVQPYRNWEGRAYRRGQTELNAGVSQLDLYWKRYERHESGAWQADDPQYKIEDIVYWSAAAPGAVEHVFPGAVVEIPVGAGRLILNQIRWETEKVERADRLVSLLMAALDVAVRPYVPDRELPAGVRYEPYDLRPYANRGFIDEVGDDGMGGWSDQGPRHDMRFFPTGERRFVNIPFRVGEEPHGCIVLRSNFRPFPEKQPEEVMIPIGRSVEGLVFLHGLTYGGGGPVGLYGILYEDGSSVDIPLVAGENIRDWIETPVGFPRERGTRSRVAWTGSTDGGFSQVSVYAMTWVNPKPDVAVRAVRFANPGRNGCPILIGLTLAVSGDASPVPVAADTRRAQERFAAGMEHFRAGRMDEARAAFEEATAADPGLDAARQQLGRLHEQLGQDDEALAVYRAWTEHGTATPLPYNRIGEILERLGDVGGAIEAYTRSLEIEWNQPPAIESRSRLERQRDGAR